ncbi:DUF4145 domain-containing protein [Lysinibacter cavernae]
MASTICGYCETYTHMTHRWSSYANERELIQVASTCDNCQRLSVGVVEDSRGSGAGLESDFNNSAGSPQWWPKAGQSPQILDVPAHIAKAAREAYSTASINANVASILMARTVVEAAAKANGITSGNLVTKIDKMKDAGLIRAVLADAAHEVRHLGNDMAHGDLDDLPDSDDVQDVLELMKQILNEVFQSPAIAARLKNRRMG